MFASVVLTLGLGICVCSIMYDPNADPELLKLDTDLCLFGDEGFRPHAIKVRGPGSSPAL